jgi:hypothetical protein
VARTGIPWRVRLVLLGILIGVGWAVVMWLLTTAIGQDSGVRGLLYLMLTLGMIGGGVASVFGIFAARKRGERVTPRGPYRRKP